MMAINVQSSAFSEGETIPVKFTCKGEDVSPPLTWSDVPAGTESIALICDDPDAPMGTWVHWVLYGLSTDTRSLPEAVASDAVILNGAKQGKNDFGRLGYGGPCPPPGSVHRYFFKVYALDEEPDLPPGATKASLLNVMKDHILAEGKLMGRFQR